MQHQQSLRSYSLEQAQHNNLNHKVHYTSHSPDSQRQQQLFLGTYEVEALIGSGSFGQVFRCRHIKTGKRYAIKEFKNKFSNRKKAFETREIQILMKLEEASQKKGYHCPFILKAEQIEFENKRVYAVFELMDMSLTQYLRKRSKA